jgi:flagellar export protein FliJ
MNATGFRFKTLLELHQKAEDMLIEEIARLQGEKVRALKQLELWNREYRKTKRTIASGGEGREIEITLRYMERLSRYVDESRRKKGSLEAEIEVQMEELKKAKMERKRFEILRAHSIKALEQMRIREEQKVLDEYSQRKTNV